MLNQTINELPNGTKVATGVNVRSAIEDTRKIFKKNSDAALRKLNEASGGVKIQTDIIGNALKTLQKQGKDNIFNSAESSLVKNVKNKNILEGKVNAPVTTLRNAMSYLNRQIRKGEKGLTTEDIDVGALKFMVGEINKQVRRDAPDSFVNAFDIFNDVYAKGKSKLDDTIIADVMKIRNKQLVYGDEAVFDLTFKKGLNSKKVADDLYDVIKDYPDAMLAYKSSINDFYKKEVIDNGKVNVNKHKTFLKNFEDKLKVFFSPKEYEKIKKIGGLQETINNIEKNRDTLIKNLSRSFEGKLESSTPGELVNKIFEAFKTNVMKDLNERVTVKSGSLGMDVISPERFKQYVYGSGGEKGYQFAMREIFGNKFMSDIKTLNDALQITARTAPASLQREGVYGNFFTDIIRARVGQFTPTGRLLTAGKRIYTRASNAILKNAILNPESLKDLVKLKTLKKSSAEAAYILGKLNGMIFLDPTQG